jgi:hypothetical protein
MRTWFSLYHAYQTPKLEIVGIETEKLSDFSAVLPQL